MLGSGPLVPFIGIVPDFRMRALLAIFSLSTVASLRYGFPSSHCDPAPRIGAVHLATTTTIARSYSADIVCVPATFSDGVLGPLPLSDPVLVPNTMASYGLTMDQLGAWYSSLPPPTMDGSSGSRSPTLRPHSIINVESDFDADASPWTRPTSGNAAFTYETQLVKQADLDAIRVSSSWRSMDVHRSVATPSDVHMSAMPMVDGDFTILAAPPSPSPSIVGLHSLALAVPSLPSALLLPTTSDCSEHFSSSIANDEFPFRLLVALLIQLVNESALHSLFRIRPYSMDDANKDGLAHTPSGLSLRVRADSRIELGRLVCSIAVPTRAALTTIDTFVVKPLIACAIVTASSVYCQTS